MALLQSWTGHAVDVAVVGAGAAGLAAARHVMAARPDLSVLVLEAGARLGGRAHTLGPEALGAPVDLGCGWLHGARDNAWTGIAGELGFALDRTPAPWDGGGRDLGLPLADEADQAAARARFFERADAFPETAPDVALSTFLEPGGRWNALFDAVGTYINGVDLAGASARDYARYDPGRPPDWRVVRGYGRLVGAYGEAVPVVTGAAVSRIEHGHAARLRLHTARGTLDAAAAVVAVPTNVLASGALSFDPALPGKAEAAGRLPLGQVEKLYVALTSADGLPTDGHLIGSPFRTGTGAYQVRPSGRPVIEGFYGGDLARDLRAGGLAAAMDFAARELAGRFGTAFKARLGRGVLSNWGGDPRFGGAYSYAPPGCSDARAVLAEPASDRIAFAGEACSRPRFSTAHGAYETGVAAAGFLLGGPRLSRGAGPPGR